ncbi:MAG: lytic transglycosylase domain-containing protein [Rhodobacteraceae bacterium]|nr:MAG: lytic transglycosylase domain-containing protein [Paracoccaceae bacterium]
MTRILGLLCACLLLAFPAQADPSGSLAQAMTAMRAGDWDGARARAADGGDLARDIVEWHRLRAGQGDLAAVRDFLSRRGDWPGLDWLVRQSEEKIAEAPDAQVLAFFDANSPRSPEGVLAHARALIAAGRKGDAEVALVRAWRTMAMPQDVQDLYLDRHGSLLRDHHAARLDQMIWQRDMTSARQMLPLVSEGWQALARARIALHDQADGVDTLISNVPADLAGDPGLAFERFVWRDRKGRDDDAIALLLERSTGPDALGQPQAWAPRRHDLARQVMRAGDGALAYRIASRHFTTEGSGFAELEWLSGYLALRYLDDPETALQHFQRFDAAVASPISKGRAGYWKGRAYEAMGDDEAAALAYRDGARHQTSYYGLLAAERGGLPFDATLAGRDLPAWRDAPFTRSSVFAAGKLLLAAGELDLAERFLTHLAERLDADEAAQLGAMAVDLDRPHLGVMIGKRLAQSAIVVPAAYYPLHRIAKAGLPMHPEMILAIARRESEFDPSVVSGAGARGLMQVMPRTAEQVARQLGLEAEHSSDRLLTDPDYNAKLGATYLFDMAQRFGGNVVMMAAAYNAGPSRPETWMAERGDPRTGRVDVIDWIEHVPFEETRNYIMRVAESLPVYRARLGLPPHPVPFSQELVGDTLRWPAD